MEGRKEDGGGNQMDNARQHQFVIFRFSYQATATTSRNTAELRSTRSTFRTTTRASCITEDVLSPTMEEIRLCRRNLG